MTGQILLVEDDASVRDALVQTLELAEYKPTALGSFVAARDFITADFDGVVISDIRMPGRDGFHLLAYAQEQDQELPVVLLTGEGDIPMAVKAMSNGAFDFLEKPCSPKSLIAAVDRAMKVRKLVLENRVLKAQVSKGDIASRLIVGSSPLTAAHRERVRRLARITADVLVVGPPGTGTGTVAEVVHSLSARSGPGPTRRAAAGLDRAELAAAVEQADGGTLFIDEVAAMPPDGQLALFEYLETPHDVRVVAGTYQDIDQLAETGQFHFDLFHFLDAVRLEIPALDDRREDIPAVFRFFVSEACRQIGQADVDVSDSYVAELMARSWPGNTQALRNVATRHVLGLSSPDEDEADSLSDRMARVERSFLTDALLKAGGHASEAARILQIPRKTFYDKLTRHGIRPDDFR